MLRQKVSSVTSVSEIDRLKISLLNCLMCCALEYNFYEFQQLFIFCQTGVIFVSIFVMIDCI